jgi:CRISPR-associated protein Csx10
VKVITYRITLLEPTLVTALDGDPNSAVAFNYLPGSVLRGAMIGKHLRVKNLTPDQFDAAAPEAKRLFFDGATHYLNGYLRDRQLRRSLPTPQSWQRQKGKETPFYDFAVKSPEPPLDKEQWQSAPRPFCTLTEDCVRLVHPDRHIAVHTARNRRFGRPQDPRHVRKDEDPGAVYRYDALAAGQTFDAAILCNDADTAYLISLLKGEATLGGSRSGGYGRVLFENAEETATWREVGGVPTPDVEGKLIVTLLSDALLRDNNGQFVVDPEVVTAALAARLGKPLTLKQAFLRGQAIGGFNRKWGLPLPQSPAVQMGSVFVYDAPSCEIAKLQELEAQGIGERRAEGFGRVAINWHVEEEWDVEEPIPPSSSLTVGIPVNTEGEKIAKRMAERMLRQQLEERLIAAVNRFTLNNLPSNAQLSRLRNIIHDELMKETPNPQRVATFLSDVRQRSTARKQFERARVNSERLSEWLERTCQKTSEDEWKMLLDVKAQDARKLGGVEATLTETIRAEFILRLIDGVLARSAKESRKEA